MEEKNLHQETTEINDINPENDQIVETDVGNADNNAENVAEAVEMEEAVEQQTVNKNNQVESVSEQNCDEKQSDDKKKDSVIRTPVEISETNEEPVKNKKKISFTQKKKVKQVFKTCFAIIFWIIGLVMMFMCISNIYQRQVNPDGYVGLFGIGNATVSSNSMEDILFEGDLIFYKSVDTDQLSAGDIVVYKKNNAQDNTILIVHNLMSLENGYAVTQGENNAFPDEAFPTSLIVGKYLFKVPYVGTVLSSMSSQWAPFAILIVILCVFALRIAAYTIHKKKIIDSVSKDVKTREAIDYFFNL